MNKLTMNLLLYMFLFFAAVFAYLAFLLGRNVSNTYLWLLVPGVFFGVLSYWEYRRLERQKLLARLRSEWGVSHLNKKRDFSEISALFEQSQHTNNVIDDCPFTLFGLSGRDYKARLTK